MPNKRTMSPTAEEKPASLPRLTQDPDSPLSPKSSRRQKNAPGEGRHRVWVDEMLFEYEIPHTEIELTKDEFKQLANRMFNYASDCTHLDSLEDFCALGAYFIITCPNIDKGVRPFFNQQYRGPTVSLDEIVRKYTSRSLALETQDPSGLVGHRRKFQALMRDNDFNYQRAVFGTVCCSLLHLMTNPLRSRMSRLKNHHMRGCPILYGPPKFDFEYSFEFLSLMKKADEKSLCHLRRAFRLLIQHLHDEKRVRKLLSGAFCIRYYALDIPEFILQGLERVENSGESDNGLESLTDYIKHDVDVLDRFETRWNRRFRTQYKKFKRFLRFHDSDIKESEYIRELPYAHFDTAGRFKRGELGQKTKLLWPYAVFIDPINMADLDTRNNPEMAMFALGFSDEWDNVARNKDFPDLYYEWLRFFITEYYLSGEMLEFFFEAGAKARFELTGEEPGDY